MGRAVVFNTPGLIDLKAFTTFGANAKPNTTNPIGYFGTGLKYAIAVLVREKIPVTMWIGRHKYHFELSTEDFRGTDLDMIVLKRSKGTFFTKTHLPFTTSLAKNWELWMAFRELYANTLDEKGDVFIIDYDPTTPRVEDFTKIVVESDKFVECFLEKDKIFLPDGLTQRVSLDGVQVIARPSRSVYYRGLRVMDFEENVSSIYTYNILRYIELTEDRTIKYPFYADWWIREAIAKSNDIEFIKGVIIAKEGFYEEKLDFKTLQELPSEAFKEAVRELRTREVRYNPTIKHYVQHYDPPAREPMTTYKLAKALHAAMSQGNMDRVTELIDCNQRLFLDIADTFLKYYETNTPGITVEALHPTAEEAAKEALQEDIPF